jgi:predicted nucleic acid-binding protein
VILVDTSVWTDHLHHAEPGLVADLESGIVAQHPMVVVELALGSLRNRGRFISLLAGLPQTPVASHSEVGTLIEHERLYGRGLSLVDAHLLGALRLAPGTSLWTRDTRLRDAARSMGIQTRP